MLFGSRLLLLVASCCCNFSVCFASVAWRVWCLIAILWYTDISSQQGGYGAQAGYGERVASNGEKEPIQLHGYGEIEDLTIMMDRQSLCVLEALLN